MARKPNPSNKTKTRKAIEDAPPAELQEVRDWLRQLREVMKSLRPTHFLYGAGNWYDENGRVRINWVALRPQVEGIAAATTIVHIDKLLLEAYEPPSAHLQAWLQLKNACDQIRRRLGTAPHSPAPVRVPLEERTDVLESVPVLVRMIDGILREGKGGDVAELQAEAVSGVDQAELHDRSTTDTALQSGVHLGGGMCWQDASEKATRHVKRNGFPGVNALAELVGCAGSTMSKAIQRSAYLKARKAEHKAKQTGRPRQTPMTDAQRDSLPQTTEVDPATDEAGTLKQLIDEQNGDKGNDPSPLDESLRRYSR